MSDLFLFHHCQVEFCNSLHNKNYHNVFALIYFEMNTQSAALETLNTTRHCVCVMTASRCVLQRCEMVKLALCLTKRSTTPWRHTESGGKAPHILNIDAWWSWVVSLTYLPLLPGKKPPVLIGYEAEWAPESVWAWWRREKTLPLPGIETRSSSQ